MRAVRQFLTSRDEAIIQLVFSYDGTAIQHIQQRFFPTPGARSACYTRIRTLVKAGYLTASRIPSQTGLGTGKAFLAAGAKARPLLAKLLGTNAQALWRGTRVHAPAIIAHHLAICDIRLSVELAAVATPSFARMAWTTEHVLRTKPMVVADEATGESITLIPDGRLQLTRSDGRSQAFFVEVDRGTITEHQRLVKRLRGYLLHARVELVPVLFIVPNPQRQMLLAKLAAREARTLGADPTLFFLTQHHEVTPATVLRVPIWQAVGVPAPVALAPDEPSSSPHAQEGTRA